MLACAQEDAVWDRTCAHNKLRSLLREYYPGNHRSVRRPTPRPAPLGRPRRPRRRSYPARGREAQQDPTAGAAATRRPTARIDAEADRSRRCPAPSTYTNPRWSRTRWAVKRSRCSAQLDTACVNADELAAAVIEQFEAHPDAAIIASQPGLGALTGARVLTEIGDDRSRLADARALKAYAGAAPVTRASGKSRAVMHRRIKNHRLADAGHLWLSPR